MDVTLGLLMESIQKEWKELQEPMIIRRHYCGNRDGWCCQETIVGCLTIVTNGPHLERTDVNFCPFCGYQPKIK